MKSSYLLYLLFSFIFHSVFPYSLSGNYLQDLESNIAADFIADTAYWTASPGLVTSGVEYSFCYNNYLLGGYNILQYPQGYFSRDYSGLPSHNMVRFSFLAQPVDSWDGATSTYIGDTFQLQFDGGTVITCWILSTYSSYSGSNICGNSAYADYPSIRTVVDFPHSATTLTL